MYHVSTWQIRGIERSGIDAHRTRSDSRIVVRGSGRGRWGLGEGMSLFFPARRDSPFSFLPPVRFVFLLSVTLCESRAQCHSRVIGFLPPGVAHDDSAMTARRRRTIFSLSLSLSVPLSCLLLFSPFFFLAFFADHNSPSPSAHSTTPRTFIVRQVRRWRWGSWYRPRPGVVFAQPEPRRRSSGNRWRPIDSDQLRSSTRARLAAFALDGIGFEHVLVVRMISTRRFRELCKFVLVTFRR